jgi:hypothetical protein
VPLRVEAVSLHLPPERDRADLQRLGNPADSVLDDRGEARWVKRLFVADNSALSNALGGPNPTLTTQALATRTAEKIFCTYFDGEPWVEREAPVSSIDREVTKAVVERCGR